MKYMNRHVALKVSEIVLSFFLLFCFGNIARWCGGESGLDKTILLLVEVTEVFGLEQREVSL